MLASKQIMDRLLLEAENFARPDVRIQTLQRLEEACDAIEDGRAAVDIGTRRSGSARKRQLKINPSTIESYAKAKEWTGPTRSFLAAEKNGLTGYWKAREFERTAGNVNTPKFPSQVEAYISEIESDELRQFFRQQIEQKRKFERELKLLKSGLKQFGGFDVDAFLNSKKALAIGGTKISTDMTRVELQTTVKSLVKRLIDTERLRHLGLKLDGNDVLSLTNAIVVKSDELRAIIKLAELPESLMPTEDVTKS